jgi:hypothetical protein
MFLYGPKSDQAALSGGSWQTGLPLANLKSQQLYKVARSTNANPSSTKFFIDLGGVETFRAIVAGPTNLTNTYSYRIRSYTDNGFGTVVYDSDWIAPSTPIPFGTLPYGAPYWWDGLVPWDDADRKGPWIIHILEEPTAGQCWGIEIDAPYTPDGYIEIGRLFMAGSLIPSFDYTYEGNAFGIDNNSLQASTLSGGLITWRRVNPRTFQCAFRYLPEDEVFRTVYPFLRDVGFDGEVFVIPDPDSEHIQKRSFLATIRQNDGIQQSTPLRGDFGFQVREII